MTTTAEEPVWEHIQTVTPRDRYDRPLVVPPNAKEPIPVPYTRVTTYIEAPEDQHNLDLYHQRLVARGLAKREALLLRVASLGDMPGDDGPLDKEWKKTLNALCKQAQEADQGSDKATTGSALHAFTERHDRGQEVGNVPAAYQKHVDNYVAATAGFRHRWIEKFTVYDQLQLGGTPDRVSWIPGHDKLVIVDTKTGRTDFGVGKMAMQLAIYAHSVVYDFGTQQRTPLGDVDLENGLIVALNARTGDCELKWIDIGKAWRYIGLPADVRAWRKVTGWLRPFDQGPINQGSGEDLVEQAQRELTKLIGSSFSREDLLDIWKRAGNVWGPEHTEHAKVRLAMFEQQPTIEGI
jgi:hypothetical protein